MFSDQGYKFFSPLGLRLGYAYAVPQLVQYCDIALFPAHHRLC